MFARSARIDAALPLTRLPRLLPYLAGLEGQVSVALQFRIDEEGRKQLAGSVEAGLKVQCQRCLQPMTLEVASELDLLVFADQREFERQQQESGSELADHDVLVLDEAAGTPGVPVVELELVSLVEDELILSLPLAPVHGDAACNERLNQIRGEQERQESVVEAARVSPFAVLSQLKGKADKGFSK